MSALARSIAPLLAVTCLFAGAAEAQNVLDPVLDLDFDEPESWAMKFFTSVSLQTSVGAVADRDAGDVSLGLELLSVPHLDREQRTVGFGGFKEEDLNRSAAWARLRAELGLGAGWGLVVGWAPPVEVDGVEADLWSLAIEKALWRSRSASLGVRVYAQAGEASGDLTCAEGGDERFPPGSEQNPFGCLEPSSDEITMDYAGVELVGSYDPAPDRGGGVPELHAGISFNRLDMEFQVDAQTFDFRDLTLLRTEGDTTGIALGATWDTGRRGRLAAEVFYSPLDVRRIGQPRERDDLVHLRLLWRWQVR